MKHHFLWIVFVPRHKYLPAFGCKLDNVDHKWKGSKSQAICSLSHSSFGNFLCHCLSPHSHLCHPSNLYGALYWEPPRNEPSPPWLTLLVSLLWLFWIYDLDFGFAPPWNTCRALFCPVFFWIWSLDKCSVCLPDPQPFFPSALNCALLLVFIITCNKIHNLLLSTPPSNPPTIIIDNLLHVSHMQTTVKTHIHIDHKLKSQPEEFIFKPAHQQILSTYTHAQPQVTVVLFNSAVRWVVLCMSICWCIVLQCLPYLHTIDNV